MVGFLDRNAGRIFAALLVSLGANAFLGGVAIAGRDAAPLMASSRPPGPVDGPGAAMADALLPFAGFDRPAVPRFAPPRPFEDTDGPRGGTNDFAPHSADFLGDEALP